jgi:GNAT superfamily N-acetyltransferase
MTEVVRLERRHSRDLFQQVARLHARSIHHGVLPQLGCRFLAEVYTAVAQSDHGFVLVAKKRETVQGFVAGSTRLYRLYAAVLLKNGWQLGLSAGAHLHRIALWKKVWSVLLFPGRKTSLQRKTHCVPELLAIAVTKNQRRRGLGSRLLQAFEDELKTRGGDRTYTVATNAAEVASNRFYEKSGFHPIGTMVHHQLTLQLYEKEF